MNFLQIYRSNGVQTCPYLRLLEENKTGKGQTTKF